MKIKLDLRLWLTIASIVVGLAYAIIILTPKYWLGDDLGYGWMDTMGRLHQLLFPLLFATLLSYIFGRSNNKILTKPHKNLGRTLAGLAVLTIIGSYIITAVSVHISVMDETRNKFVFENTGTALLIASYVFVLLLLNIQKFVYWPLWSRKDRSTADERQLVVRNRVFEKTYRYIVAIVAIYWVVNPKIINTSFDPSRLELISGYLAVLLLTGLSSIVAAWQKDS